MGNRAESVLNSIRQNCSEAINEKARSIISTTEKISTAKQGKLIKSTLEMLEANSVDVRKVMRPCNCLPESIINKAKDIFVDVDKDIEALLRLLNENHIGGGKLHFDQGKIIGIYSQCYCGIPKGTKDMPACYCECSAGWFEKLFSGIFEREVTVNIRHTILNGYEECIFEII